MLRLLKITNFRFNLELLQEVMMDRGEYISSDGRGSRELNLRHLFYGHEIDVGSKFLILGSNHNNKERLAVSVEHTEQLNLFEDLREGYQNLVDPDVISTELQASGLSALGIIIDADDNFS